MTLMNLIFYIEVYAHPTYTVSELRRLMAADINWLHRQAQIPV